MNSAVMAICMYLHMYMQTKTINGKSLFYWVIPLQQIVPLTP